QADRPPEVELAAKEPAHVLEKGVPGNDTEEDWAVADNYAREVNMVFKMSVHDLPECVRLDLKVVRRQVGKGSVCLQVLHRGDPAGKQQGLRACVFGGAFSVSLGLSSST